MTTTDFPNLAKIQSPADLRRLPADDLVQLADELRAFLVHTVSQCGGHFAAGLGTVELTVALHYIFNTPDDRLVWDVGHQAYPHKVLTGRRDQLHTIRQWNGLAPFPKRKESEYDSFGVGHSSTSISAALGMAIAAHRQQSDRHAVAIIGDGGITGGMAFEALNHGGHMRDLNLLVVLNDNDMSISENVGALNHYFSRIWAAKSYQAIREGGKKVLENMPTAWEVARRSEEFMKGMVAPGIIFEELGFNYFGPIDGHDLPLLVNTLERIKQIKGPQFLHVVTRKGKGYLPAENDPIKWHGVSQFNAQAGTMAAKKSSGKARAYTSVFGEWLCDMAEQDERIMGITPAMREGSGLVEFSKRFPERYFDVGIAEQHAVTLAAGFACEGMLPIVAIYSTFLQRAYDQLIHDVAIQNLPVVFAIDRAGVVGPDGQTHAGSFDYSYLRCIPEMVIMAPGDENECRQMLYTGTTLKQPSAIRYPRGNGTGAEIQQTMTTLPIGKAEVRREGQDIAFLAFGALLPAAEALAAELNGTAVNMRFIKPLDETLVIELAQTHKVLVTLEDNAIMGGAGSAVNECLLANDQQVQVINLGLPDRYIDHGSREQLLADAGLDIDSIRQTLQQRLPQLRPSQAANH